MASEGPRRNPLQDRLYWIIFGTESTSGRWFDIALIVTILVSVSVIVLDSISEIHNAYGALLQRIEWGFTLIFSIEYALRIWIAKNRRAYVTSVYGIIDLLAILPSYLAFLLPQTAPLLIVRLVRVLRVFRVLRLMTYLHEANVVAHALRESARQVFVFFSMVVTVMIVFGCVMYVIEGPANGFSNIPVSVYWAIVTVTTVGYGDVVPVTPLGRTISAFAMLVGYAIIAVPTGIFTAKLVMNENRGGSGAPLNCPQCSRAGHQADARYCRFCGSDLFEETDGHRDDDIGETGGGT